MTIHALHNTEPLLYAKDELNKYLSMIDPSFQLKGNGISLGYLRDFGLSEAEIGDKTLDDVIDVSVIDSQGYIAGSNDRSVLMGVYDLLKSLGAAGCAREMTVNTFPKRSLPISPLPTATRRITAIEVNA